MYCHYTNATMNNILITDSKLENINISGAEINNGWIHNASISMSSNTPAELQGDLGVALTTLYNKIDSLQQQNTFLLKLLVSKGVLNDELELSELIASNGVINKLQGV